MVEITYLMPYIFHLTYWTTNSIKKNNYFEYNFASIIHYLRSGVSVDKCIVLVIINIVIGDILFTYLLHSFLKLFNIPLNIYQREILFRRPFIDIWSTTIVVGHAAVIVIEIRKKKKKYET